MRRPGYLGAYSNNRPGNLGDDLEARQAVDFMRGNSPFPAVIETGYIPEYLLDSGYIPPGLARRVERFDPQKVTFIPRGGSFGPASPFFYTEARFPPPRDPRTFNTLMI